MVYATTIINTWIGDASIVILRAVLTPVAFVTMASVRAVSSVIDTLAANTWI